MLEFTQKMGYACSSSYISSYRSQNGTTREQLKVEIEKKKLE
jgi:hypothetical protein